MRGSFLEGVTRNVPTTRTEINFVIPVCRWFCCGVRRFDAAVFVLENTALNPAFQNLFHNVPTHSDSFPPYLYENSGEITRAQNPISGEYAFSQKKGTLGKDAESIDE